MVRKNIRDSSVVKLVFQSQLVIDSRTKYCCRGFSYSFVKFIFFILVIIQFSFDISRFVFSISGLVSKAFATMILGFNSPVDNIVVVIAIHSVVKYSQRIN